MIYFDNAATTVLDTEVISVMNEVMSRTYGNPSSIHSAGRESRVIIEDARKQIATFLNATPAEIVFTSGGTEAINIAFAISINKLGVKSIIASPLEHPAVINTARYCAAKGTKTANVRLLEKGTIDLNHLEELLKSELRTQNSELKTLVCLMHANNELGNLLPIKDVSALSRKYNAMFLSDMVQTFGKYDNNLKNIDLDFTACSAHKFHGPKGIGFLYINKDLEISPVIHGGGQERNIRSGTENIYGIAGMAKAVEIAHRDMEENRLHISSLKDYMKENLKSNFTDIEFNGTCESEGLYNILNVSFPETEKTRMLIQKLDINGICISGGSACHSSEASISYVLEAIGTPITRTSLRFSFGKFNTKNEIDTCIATISNLLKT